MRCYETFYFTLETVSNKKYQIKKSQQNFTFKLQIDLKYLNNFRYFTDVFDNICMEASLY